MNDLPNFLVTRFAPGSAGNFLTTLLQCSKTVAHFDRKIEINKPNVDWSEYFSQAFNLPLESWVTTEPGARSEWGTREIFSSSYERGNHLTIPEYLELEKFKTSNYFKELRKTNKLLPTPWNKGHVPLYFKNAITISILLDKKSLRWYDHSVYRKHHTIKKVNEDKSIEVQMEENAIQNHHIQQFGNKHTKIYDSFRSFVKDRITSKHQRCDFQDIDFIKLFKNNNHIIELSDLLLWERLEITYYEVCSFCGIKDPLDKSTLKTLFTYWRNLHDY